MVIWHRRFAKVDITDEGSVPVSMNVIAGAVDFSVPKGTFRLIKELNNHLLSHATPPARAIDLAYPSSVNEKPKLPFP